MPGSRSRAGTTLSAVSPQARREEAARLLVSSFVLVDPWRTITTASVPYWTFFSVRPALDALDAHLAVAGAVPHLTALDTNRFPHDIGLLGRYDSAIDQLPRARRPWSPMPVQETIEGLQAAGLDTAPTETRRWPRCR